MVASRYVDSISYVFQMILYGSHMIPSNCDICSYHIFMISLNCRVMSYDLYIIYDLRVDAISIVLRDFRLVLIWCRMTPTGLPTVCVWPSKQRVLTTSVVMVCFVTRVMLYLMILQCVRMVFFLCPI